jgi:hypothetical protein
MTVKPEKGCPRVFRSFIDEEGNSYDIDFMCPFDEKDHPLMFKALTMIGGTSRQAIVKIVYGQYGERVHRLLAERDMAPKLYGIGRLEGGPLMIVMEDINVNKEWTTLYSIIPQGPNAGKNNVIREKVHPRLLDIVGTLKANDFVHGDIRSNNIMVKKRHEEQCVLIDFDWAGKVGEVKYPFDLNPAITRTGIPGTAIGFKDDDYMLKEILSST